MTNGFYFLYYLSYLVSMLVSWLFTFVSFCYLLKTRVSCSFQKQWQQVDVLQPIAVFIHVTTVNWWCGMTVCLIDIHVQKCNFHFSYFFNPLYKPQWLLYVPSGLTFTNSTFCHTVYFCVLFGSEKQRLFPYTALTDWFV